MTIQRDNLFGNLHIGNDSKFENVFSLWHQVRPGKKSAESGRSGWTDTNSDHLLIKETKVETGESIQIASKYLPKGKAMRIRYRYLTSKKDFRRYESSIYDVHLTTDRFSTL